MAIHYIYRETSTSKDRTSMYLSLSHEEEWCDGKECGCVNGTVWWWGGLVCMVGEEMLVGDDME